MTGSDLVTVVSVLTAVGLLAERLTGLLSAARARRNSSAEPAQTIAQAAATVAASVDDIIGPLREELRELRAEVHALRDVLASNGIPAPRPPFA